MSGNEKSQAKCQSTKKKKCPSVCPKCGKVEKSSEEPKLEQLEFDFTASNENL